MLRRYLAITEPNPLLLDQMTFADLISAGLKHGLLLHGWDKWTEYRAAHTTIRQSYDKEKAAYVFARIPAFLAEADYLAGKMRPHGTKSV